VSLRAACDGVNLNKVKKNQSVTRSAVLMSAGTFLSRILGFVRDAVVAALFGRTATDVFAAAFALPNFFRRLLGEGSLSVAFIPVYVDRVESDEQTGENRAKGLANAMLTLVSLVSLVICTACFVGMEPLLKWWLGENEFMSVPGKFELAVKLSRITIFYLFLVTIYAYFMAIAQALHRFFIPAMAPALFNLFFIVTVFAPDMLFSVSETKLAWAVLVGGAFQALVVIILLYRMGVLPRPSLQLNLPGVKTVALNMAPGILGLAASQMMNIMNQKFAAGLEEGAMTYVYYTNRLLELPQSLIAISIGTALLPTLSKQHAQGDMSAFARTTEEQLKLFYFLAIPSALGLFLLADPIVSLLFERGQWTAADSVIVSALVQIIALQLLFSGTSRILIPGFYALKNTKVPALLTTVIVTFHILLAPVLMKSYGVHGLIASVAFSGLFGVLLSSFVYRILVTNLSWVRLFKDLLRLIPGLIAITGVCVVIRYSVLDSGIFHGSSLQDLVVVGLAVPLSGLVYFGLGSWLNITEAKKVTNRLRKRVRG